MKKVLKKVMVLLMCLTMFSSIAYTAAVNVRADERTVIATVNGTVLSGTTYDLLQLDSNGQKYKIRIDSETDTSGCKLLLPGNKVAVQVCYGNDKFLHAVKITTLSADIVPDSEKTNKATVNGNIKEGSTAESFKITTMFGELLIKVDGDTDFSGCKVFTIGKNVDVTLYRGKDSCYHAISVSDGAGKSTSYIVTNPSGTTYTITGEAKGNSTDSILYLNTTNNGIMEIRIDLTTNTTNARAIMPGAKLTVNYFKGSDGNLHASVITGVRKASDATVDTSKKYTVTGTISNKTTENVLTLTTSTGDMLIKLDTTTEYSGLAVLITGQKIEVSCSRGSDAYLHANSITAK